MESGHRTVICTRDSPENRSYAPMRYLFQCRLHGRFEAGTAAAQRMLVFTPEQSLNKEIAAPYPAVYRINGTRKQKTHAAAYAARSE